MTKKILACVPLASLVALAAPTAPAHACGGFFCSQQPVDQSGEQIVFSMHDRGVTVHIQIAYTGAAKDFSWIVPVMSKPRDIKLGSQAVFTQLTPRTQPQWRLDLNVTGTCGFRAEAASAGAAPPAARSADGVQVLDEREVGPFDVVVLEAKDAEVLTSWLNKNGYDQPPQAYPLIDHYVKAGMMFVALKLKKDAMVGEIQPLVLEMGNPEACVPLILTRIAAVPDMPVLVYVLGKGRAVPRNWFEVQVNQKKIDWLASGSNYRRVVTQAIDEAGGHGFVTEYAGASDVMKNALYRPGQFNLDQLRTITDPAIFVRTLLNMGFPRDQTMQALLRKHIPMPDAVRAMGVTEQRFYNSLDSYRSYLGGIMFDPVAFVRDLEERVIKPLMEAQAMFDTQPYLTRMLSTVSPAEMTRDPLFQFNPSLPKVSNVHVAKLTGACAPDGSIVGAAIVLETGERIEFKDPIRPFGPPPGGWSGGAGEPSARQIALVGTVGTPAVYTAEQAKAADQLLDRETPESVRVRPPAELGSPGSKESSGGLFGCRLGGRGGAGWASALLLAAALGALRLARRRGRRA